MSHCKPLEVVDRGNETQPQVADNLNKVAYENKKRVNKYQSVD